MGGCYDLTDFEWSVIEPLLPNKPRGVPRVDDLLERYGPYTICYNRFVRWRKAGVWERIEAQGAAPNIPDKSNRKQRHCFSKILYRERNHVERFFNNIKHFWRIETRFEKHADNYLAMLKLAAIRIWLRVNESMT